MIDEDHGVGDAEMFSADDLERLYQQSQLDRENLIQGSSLNKILHVSTYEPNAWYRVVASGVEKI